MIGLSLYLEIANQKRVIQKQTLQGKSIPPLKSLENQTKSELPKKYKVLCEKNTEINGHEFGQLLSQLPTTRWGLGLLESMYNKCVHIDMTDVS